MSEFKLPTRKGTELFPRVIQQPVKVRFDGVPEHSREAQLMLDAMGGEINHFHRKAEGAYELSPVEVMALNGRYPSGTMRYTNVQGVASIRVTPEPHVLQQVLGKPEEEPKKGDRWETAIIDFKVPNLEETSAFFAAYRQPENPAALEYAVTGGGNAGWMTFATAEGPVSDDNDGTTFWASLKLDLTKLPGERIVKLDIYGSIAVYNEDPEGDITDSAFVAGATRRPGTVFTLSPLSESDPGAGSQTYEGPGDWVGAATLSTYDLVLVAVPQQKGPADMTWTDAQAMFPTLLGGVAESAGGSLDTLTANYYASSSVAFTYDTDNNVWESQPTGPSLTRPDQIMDAWMPTGPTVTEYWAPGIIKSEYVQVSRWRRGFFEVGDWPSYPAEDGRTYVIETLQYRGCYMPIYGSGEPEPIFITRTATIQSIMFYRGDPMDVEAKFETDDDHDLGRRWESSTLPERLMNPSGTVEIETIDIPEGDDTPANHFGRPKLGTLTVDIIGGSVKWKAA